MNNERAQNVDLVFNSGVRQDLNPQTAPPGSLVACDNLEFDQLQRLVRRDGFATVGKTAISKTHTVSLQVRRFAQTDDGARLLFSDDNFYQYLPTVNKMTEGALDGQSSGLRANMVDMQGIVSDQAGLIVFCDSVCVNGYAIYIYFQLPPAGGNLDVCVDVIHVASGARVFTRKTLGAAAGNYPPRLVQSGGSNVVFALWEKSGAGTTIQFSKIDLGTTPLSWGAATDLITTTGPAVFDAAQMSSGWILVYYDTSLLRPVVVTLDSGAGSTHVFAWSANGGTTAWTPSVLTVCGEATSAGARVHAVGYNNATQFIESVTLTTALATPAYGRFNPGLAAGKPAVQMAIARTAAAQTIYAFSNYTSAPTAGNPRGHLYIYTLDSASAGSVLQKVYANYSLGGRIYVDTFARDGSIFMVARFNEVGGAQSHLLLLDLGSVSLNILAPQPVCHFANGRISYDDDNVVTGIAGIADLSSVQAGLFQVAALVNIGANSGLATSGNQIQAWSFQSRGSSRFLPVSAQGQVVVAGGTPLVYDGQRLVEQSFYSYPSVISGAGAQFVVSNVGGNIPQGVYQYRIVWEWCDAAGNRHQSPASPAQTIDISGPTYAAGTASIRCNIPVMPATRKQGGPGAGDTYSIMLAQPYRTTNGGAIFYKLPVAGTNSTTTTTDTFFVDIYTDDNISGNEILYTQAGGLGLLASTAPPASLVMTVHQQRLWGVDCEYPERIWCTRVFQQGSAAAYSPALQILIPGAGRINGLAGQDGKLYALATNGIFLATYGDGPDDTGAGVFPSPELITATANCQDPRGVLVGQDGIFFTGIDQWGTGIYMIPRGDGQPRSIGKRVRSELAACPVCRGVVNRTQKSRTEFLFVDSDTNPTKSVILYYHHDYVDQEGVGQWTVARVSNGTALECLGEWDDVSVIADESNNIGWQTPGTVQDFGSTYPVIKIETTDVRPTGLVGFAQIAGMTLLGTASTSDPLTFTLSYDSGFTFADTFAFGSPTESAGQPVLRRCDPVKQKQFDGGAVRVRIMDTAINAVNPGTSYFHGISLEVVPLGGNARLDNARRG